jgi:hypothetical protein
LAPLNAQLGSGFCAEIFFLDVTYTDAAGPQARTLMLRLQPQNVEVVFGSDLRIQGNMMRAERNRRHSAAGLDRSERRKQLVRRAVPCHGPGGRTIRFAAPELQRLRFSQ